VCLPGAEKADDAEQPAAEQQQGEQDNGCHRFTGRL
jgi:hypothetical protein